MLGFFRGHDLVGGVEQSLRWDAAAIQTNAAKSFVLLDKDDFLPQVSGIEGSGVPARPGAEDDDVSGGGFHIGTYCFLFFLVLVLVPLLDSFNSASSDAITCARVRYPI